MIDSATLLSELTQITQNHIKQAEQFLILNDDQLTFRKSPESWNILECIEHLNLYGNYYLPEIECKMDYSASQYSDSFEPGFWGDYFAKSMVPGHKMMKMKTFKSKNPMNKSLDRAVILRFMSQQKELLELLHKARTVDINSIKIKTTLSFLFRLKLGDTFRFIVNHNTRHLVQAEKVLKSSSLG